ncbi:MAG: 7-cyano-7-deazaguanine synthase QueC [Candidatus Omnitrophica bacterium]|nr:7-cyano-7-deazaguanine synthase QueC [Candidatus Omnitrophota bacterium]MCM8791133.1 7-cyano-7-deazaguanine synthase QueC [Candidatus Omnitrophota bacterium]
MKDIKRKERGEGKKAIILLSGGLDSAVTLYYAMREGYQCYCLAFDYGQRHAVEMAFARKIASKAGVPLKIVSLRLPWKGSSLVDDRMPLPVDRTLRAISKGIPSTYVPARNKMFISIAASYAEAIGAYAIFIGAHFQDSSGYPDCRIEFLKAKDKAIRLGTKRGLENKLRLEFPLIRKNKSQIIRLGAKLGVPFGYTWSCYSGGRYPCGRCDSCILRAKGFDEAGLKDPLYAKTRG